QQLGETVCVDQQKDSPLHIAGVAQRLRERNRIIGFAVKLNRRRRHICPNISRQELLVEVGIRPSLVLQDVFVKYVQFGRSAGVQSHIAVFVQDKVVQYKIVGQRVVFQISHGVQHTR